MCGSDLEKMGSAECCVHSGSIFLENERERRLVRNSAIDVGGIVVEAFGRKPKRNDVVEVCSFFLVLLLHCMMFAVLYALMDNMQENEAGLMNA